MRKRTGIILLIFVGVLALGAFVVWQNLSASSARAAATMRATGTLTRGELVASVNGAGNLYAPQQAGLTFGVSGVPVTKLNVKVGDPVKAGDVLAEVDAAALQQQLQTAQSNLASAQAQLDDLKAPPTAAELAMGEQQIKSAQTSYDAAVAKMNALKAPPSAGDLQAARAQLASAQASYDAAAAKNGLASDQITVARASLDKARIALEAAQAAYNAVSWRSDVGMTSQAAALQQATIDYESALASYNLTQTGINDSAVKAAQASLAQAKANLEALTKGATVDALASAQTTVEQASQSLLQSQQNLKQLKEGATQADLLAAQASVDSARAAVEQAKRQLDQAKLIAPFDGTVAKLNVVVGQTASGETGITLVNTNELETQVSLSEVDVAQVKPGQTVLLSLDALGGRQFPGRVITVSPLGTVTQGVVNYSVTVGLTHPDPAILPGMSAQASIVIAQRQNALLAPNRAIRTQGTRRVMTLLYEGREIPVLVQIGLTNDQNTEILSATLPDGSAVNLQEGDTVVLNTTATTTNQQGGFGTGRGFGPGGGFNLGEGH